MDNSRSPSHQVSVHSSGDVSEIDRRLALLEYLVEEATWPDTTQGEFLAYLAAHVLEIGSSIRGLADFERWTTVALLGRPLHERSLFLWAASIDPNFVDVYRRQMEKRINSGFRKRPGLLVGEARGVINRWEQKRTGTSGMLKHSKDVWSISSELLHHSIGLSQTASQESEQRSVCVRDAAANLQSACATLLVSLGIIGGYNAELSAKGWQYLSDLPPLDDHSEDEICT